MGARADAVTNEVELRVVGLSRSGNHAIVGWILSQARGRICFLNCVAPRHNPFTSARPTADGTAVWSNDPHFDLAEEAAGRHTRKDLLVYSYEDCYLGGVESAELRRHRGRWLGRSRRRVDVVILRDPFNLFASRKRSGMLDRRRREGEPNLVTPRVAMRMWKQHAREVLGERRTLKGELLAIRYNAWAHDQAYRRELAEALGLAFDDRAAERVPATAGGSSFDGVQFDGDAGRMRVLERWRHYADDAEFAALFDEEVQRLSEAVFGPLPGTEALVRG